MDEAMKGFEAVVKASPLNVTARFQLACLQHEYSKDYVKALVGYKMYNELAPKSDKTNVANERAALCEAAYIAKLTDEIRANENAGAAKEIADLKAKVAELEAAAAVSADTIAKGDKRINDLENENMRIRRLVSSVGEGESTEKVTKLDPDFKALLDEDTDEEDRIKFSKDVASLIADEASEKEDTATPFVVEEKKAEEKPDSADKSVRDPEQGVAKKERPKPGTIYVVKEGDTLYKIAKEQYGKASEWKLIREANKIQVTTDGRIKAGQKLILP